MSLRINWRASVNLLIDQVSALVPTLFFVIVTLHLRRSLHPPPFSSWAPVSTALQDIHKPSVKSKTAYIKMFPSFSLLSSGGHNTPQHTPTHPNTPHTLPCQKILKCMSLRINWRASVNLLIDQVSALVPTLFFVIVTLAQKSAPPFSSWAPVSTALQDIHKPSVKSKTAYINMFPSFSLLSSGGHNTPQHTPTHPKLSHAYDQVSALVPTLFSSL